MQLIRTNGFLECWKGWFCHIITHFFLVSFLRFWCKQVFSFFSSDCCPDCFSHREMQFSQVSAGIENCYVLRSVYATQQCPQLAVHEPMHVSTGVHKTAPYSLFCTAHIPKCSIRQYVLYLLSKSYCFFFHAVPFYLCKRQTWQMFLVLSKSTPVSASFTVSCTGWDHSNTLLVQSLHQDYLEHPSFVQLSSAVYLRCKQLLSAACK